MDANYQRSTNPNVPQAGEFSETLSGIFHSLREYSLERTRAAGLDLSPPVHHNVHSTTSEASSPHLYDGDCGMALFCAAYYAVTRERQARELALHLVHPLRVKLQRLAAARDALADQPLAIGGMIGMGSFLYTFGRLADWLKAPELMDAAHDVTTLITPQRIMKDERLDVVAGCAGTLLALLSFIQEISLHGGDPQLSLDLALLCGRRLLDRRIAYKSESRAWPVSGRGIPVAGFAYGAAGISCSLVRLFQQTGQEQFLEAAMEGFAFERSLFIPEQGAWLDPRTNNIADRGSWCWGPPGIALSRLGSIAVVDLPALRQDLEESLNLTRALPELRNDQYCCGNFGCIDVLQAAATHLGRLQLSDYALELSRRIVNRAAESGFCLDVTGQRDRDGKGASNFSLFAGLSGVGYALLRLSYPDVFPSVLMLESLN